MKKINKKHAKGNKKREREEEDDDDDDDEKQGENRVEKFFKKTNYAMFLFRWKRNPITNEPMLRAGRLILEFIAIRRVDTGEWAIPGVSVNVLFRCVFVLFWFVLV